MYKQGLALNNLQGLCHKTKPNLIYYLILEMLFYIFVHRALSIFTD